MLLRSKWSLVLLVVPMILVALLWNAARQRPRFVATPDTVMALALSHDGSKMAAALIEGQIVWRHDGEWNDLPIQEKIAPHISSPALQFSRDERALLGSNLYVASSHRSLAYAWNLADNAIAWNNATEDYEGIDNRFNFSPDGRRLALLSYDVIKVSDVAGQSDVASGNKRAFPTLMRQQLTRPFKRKGVTRLLYGDPFPSQIALSPDGSILVVAAHLGQLQFWDVARRKLVSQSTPAPDFISQMMAVSPDGRFVAACDGRFLFLWDKTIRRWTASKTRSGIQNVAWMPDSRSLWVGIQPSFGVFKPDDVKQVRQLSAPELKPLRALPMAGLVALAGDGHTLATHYLDGKGIWLWNIE